MAYKLFRGNTAKLHRFITMANDVCGIHTKYTNQFSTYSLHSGQALSENLERKTLALNLRRSSHLEQFRLALPLVGPRPPPGLLLLGRWQSGGVTAVFEGLPWR